MVNIDIRQAPRCSKYQYNQESETAMLVSVKGIDTKNFNRKPLDIVIVLDQSGSMEGEPLDLCKIAANFVVKELTRNDRLGIVTYDSRVHERMSLTQMSSAGKAAAATAIDRIDAGSMTNLSGGVLRGLDVLNRERSNNENEANGASRARALLVLTDGHANVGAMGQNLLDAALEGLNKCGGDVRLHTFGYGSEHNSAMLEALATSGNGSYFFVESADDIPVAIATCLGGLCSTVATSIKLRMHGVPGRSELLRVATPFPSRKVENNGIEVEIPDVYRGEEKNIIVYAYLPAQATWDEDGSGSPIASIDAEYIDSETSAPCTNSLVVAVGRQKTVTEAEVYDCTNPAVVVQEYRCYAVAEMEFAKHKADEGEFAEAEQVLAEALKALREAGVASPEQPQLLPLLIADIEETRQCVGNKESWPKTGEKIFRNRVAENSFERCNRTSSKQNSIYRTTKQAEAQSKAGDAVRQRIRFERYQNSDVDPRVEDAVIAEITDRLNKLRRAD